MVGIRMRVVLLAAMALFACTVPGQAQDSDNDGIADYDESWFAAQFMPTLHFASDEPCAQPASPFRVLYRARPLYVNGVRQTDYVAIHYVMLYLEDCGPNGHAGDAESFVVFVHNDGVGWVFDSLSATAHADTVCQNATASIVNELWVGRAKHGNFAQLSECSGGICSNYCQSNGPSVQYSLHNVGEPDAHLIDDLGAVFVLFAGERVWDDPDGRFKDSGSIEDKLYLYPLYWIISKPDGYYGCLTGCSDEFSQCEIHCSGGCDACQDAYTQCAQNCDGSNRWGR